MKIVIETSTQEDIERVIYYVKTFCIENYKEFKLFIDDKLIKEVKNE